jgi:hypothetical protein
MRGRKFGHPNTAGFDDRWRLKVVYKPLRLMEKTGL